MTRPPGSVVPVQRNQRFDMFRILFAILVIVAHAPELSDGNRNRELWNRLTGSGETLGTVAVDGFFILSGYLIVQSWIKDPEFVNFLRKRFLRIVPGYAVACILSTVAVGLLAPGIPSFFRHIGMPFVKSFLVLGVPGLPPVLPGLPYQVVNGSFWTLAYEFRCYLLVAVLGLCGFLRRRAFWLFTTVCLTIGTALPSITDGMSWHLRNNTFVGKPTEDFHLTASFFIGGCFYIFGDYIHFRRSFAVISGIVLISMRFISPPNLEVCLMIFGAYLMFHVAQLPTSRFRNIGRMPDISYGIYLYGFPVESLWIFFHKGSPWIASIVSAVVCAVLGWLSWHFVERPMLRLKKRPTATLPSP